MKTYARKRSFIKAYQWFNVSDFDDDITRDVDHYRNPKVDGNSICRECGNKMQKHGWLDNPVHGHIVCPGDYIIDDIEGKRPCKPDRFARQYELVEEPTTPAYVSTLDWCLEIQEKLNNGIK